MNDNKHPETDLDHDKVMGDVKSIDGFLKHFHTRFDGSFPTCATTLGASSYALLAQVSLTPDLVQKGQSPTIVDLGCGGGILLQQLRDMHGADAQLIGIDLVPEQIARARDLLAGQSVELLCEKAQDLPLASASVDCLLVHMGLAVMQPLDEVLVEIDRVLRPGGLFAVVLERDTEDETIDSQCSSALLRMARSERPDLIRRAAADPRLFPPATLAQVIANKTAMTPFFEPRAFDILFEASAQQYIDFAEGDYLWPYMSQDGQNALRAQIRSIFAEESREVPISMNLLCFRKTET